MQSCIPDSLFESTKTFEQLTIDEAIQEQFRLCDIIQRNFNRDEFFMAGDFGQDRSLSVVHFGGGGRPIYTAKVERVLAEYFGTEEAVLVHGAGTGGIRAMLNANLEPGDPVIVHKAHLYKTTEPAMRHMGLNIIYADYNDTEEVLRAARENNAKCVYIQRVTQQLGDFYDAPTLIRAVKKQNPDCRILVDENYSMFRAYHPSTYYGADASTFSLFKVLADSNIGCVLGSFEMCLRIRQDLASAGCQINGPEAMEALRALVYVPVALAIQYRTVQEATERINRGIEEGRYPMLQKAFSMGGIRNVMLHFKYPMAEEFLQILWSNGSNSKSVGEESRHEVTPLFTYCLSSFLKGTPGLEKEAIRINPFRSGTDTLIRILDAACADERMQELMNRYQ